MTTRALLCLWVIGVFAVTSFSFRSDAIGDTESSTHIYWRSDRPLRPNDFKAEGSTHPRAMEYCDKYGLCTIASVGFFAILDVPKKKRKRGALLERAYFAPAFEKGTSCILQEHPSGVLEQQVVFDIYEVSTRVARKNLQFFRDSLGGGYGVDYIFFETVREEAKELRDQLVNEFTDQVYIKGDPNAYDKWRKDVDELLMELEEFGTTAEDRKRFIMGVPLDQDYIMSPTLFGRMK